MCLFFGILLVSIFCHNSVWRQGERFLGFMRRKIATGFYLMHRYDYQIHCYVLCTNFDVCRSLLRCIYVSQAGSHAVHKAETIRQSFYHLFTNHHSVSCLQKIIMHVCRATFYLILRIYGVSYTRVSIVQFYFFLIFHM